MDRIMKAQNADVLTQFSEMKFKEGVISERKRIAKKLANDNYCIMTNYVYCEDDCIACWIKYFGD